MNLKINNNLNILIMYLKFQKELSNFEKQILIEFSKLHFDMIPVTNEQFDMIKEEYDHYHFLLNLGIE